MKTRWRLLAFALMAGALTLAPATAKADIWWFIRKIVE